MSEKKEKIEEAVVEEKIFRIEREPFVSKKTGNPGFAYYLKGTVRGREVKAKVVPKDKGGFEVLEKCPDFLKASAVEGSYGEVWSVRKVLRRFIWHDRIHARAMYRMAVKAFGADKVKNPFCFMVK